jgi:hypothetical protein
MASKNDTFFSLSGQVLPGQVHFTAQQKIFDFFCFLVGLCL